MIREFLVAKFFKNLLKVASFAPKGDPKTKFLSKFAF